MSTSGVVFGEIEIVEQVEDELGMIVPKVFNKKACVQSPEVDVTIMCGTESRAASTYYYARCANICFIVRPVRSC